MGLRHTIAVIGSALALGVARSLHAAELRGIVHLDGARPVPAFITIDATSKEHPMEGCGAATKPSQRLLVDPNGGVQYAVVWVDVPMTTPHGPVEDVTSTLDQHECVFKPHLLLLPVGATLRIRNSDAMLHNVRIFRDRTMLMHEWQPPHGPELTWRVPEPGRFLVRCGVHAWMHAWVVVADLPHAGVTDEAGQFTLSEIPEGRYTLRVWHETLGEQQQRVTVGAEGSVVTVHVAQGRGFP